MIFWNFRQSASEPKVASCRDPG